MKVRLKNQIILCLIIFVFGLPRTVLAGSPITLDGNFDDWIGQPSMADPAEGSDWDSDDIVKFSWATNDNEEMLYFMIERNKTDWCDMPATYYVYFDINNNGNYRDNHDRYVEVDYDPWDGSVNVNVYDRKGRRLSSYGGTWGESSSRVGYKAEFRVPMNTLGIIPPSQTIRMYALSWFSEDRVPNSGDIQWSPIPIMPNWLLAAIFVAGLVGAIIIIRKRRTVC
ncbi:MAG: hypothetical protein ACM3PE_13405 [Deltaproteobacteria bacterium]